MNCLPLRRRGAGLLLAALALLPGCAYLRYQQTLPGTLSGNLIIEWYGPDKFLVIPDARKPLTFTRANGEVIRPGMLYTDSSRLPRSLWVTRNYTPWNYTPAFVIHDWIYELHHCRVVGAQRYDPDSAAQVMAEVIRTLMDDPLYGGHNPLNLYALYRSATAPAARRLWQDGVCDTPRQLRQQSDLAEPIARFSVQF